MSDMEIPGLIEQIQQTRQNVRLSALEEATTTTVKALEDMALLEPRHHALVALALDLAQSIDATRAARNPRASAIAMLVKEYRETLAALPVPEDGDSDAFHEFMEAMNRAGSEVGL
jgi:hypothetical protein